MHAAQSGRNGNQLAYARNESADECGNVAVFAEVGFGTLKFLARQQAQMSQARIGELVDYQSSEPDRQSVVDDCSNHGAQRSEQHNQQNVNSIVARSAQYTLRLPGNKGGRRNNDLRRKWYKRRLDSHQCRDGRVVHVRRVPRDNFIDERHLISDL